MEGNLQTVILPPFLSALQTAESECGICVTVHGGTAADLQEISSRLLSDLESGI